MNNKSSLNKLIKYKKYLDIINFKTSEVIATIIFSSLFTCLFSIISMEININDLNKIIQDVTKDIGISMIGFLGFIISGLAILTSSISNKIMNIINKNKKIDIIEKILLSFYLLGIITGSVILLSFFIYIGSYSNIKFCLYLFIGLTFLLTYLVFFIIFYSISLIGNCIEIFKIINLVDTDRVSTKNDSDENDDYLFLSFRMTALESIVFSHNDSDPLDKLLKYHEKMIELINNGSTNEIQKQKFKNKLNKILPQKSIDLMLNIKSKKNL